MNARGAGVMRRGARAILGVPGLLWAAAAPAQNAPVPDDSARQIYNDVFFGQPAPPAFVVLSEDLVYRIEIEPATARVSVRVARHPGMAPLFLVPLGGDPGSSGAAAYLMVPRSSDEYRLDVTTTGGEPVRVRIWVDPKENARWARMREQSRNQRPAGISLRVVSFGPFRSMQVSSFDSTRTASADGWEACLALLPRSSWMRGALGGCVVSVTVLERSRTDGSVFFIGTAPRVELWRSPGTTSLALELQVGLGQTTTGTGTAIDYFLVGAGALLSFPLPVAARRLFGEVELGLANIQGSTGPTDAESHTVRRLAAGLQLAF